MKLSEVSQPFDTKKLVGLIQFLSGRAEDTNSPKEISQDAFINLAHSLGISINKENLIDLASQTPLNGVLDPIDPNSGKVSFKGNQNLPTKMPVDKAQDIVAKAAKSAMNKNRGV
jgi:hypothetical protein